MKMELEVLNAVRKGSWGGDILAQLFDVRDYTQFMEESSKRRVHEAEPGD